MEAYVLMSTNSSMDMDVVLFTNLADAIEEFDSLVQGIRSDLHEFAIGTIEENLTTSSESRTATLSGEGYGSFNIVLEKKESK